MSIKNLYQWSDILCVIIVGTTIGLLQIIMFIDKIKPPGILPSGF